MSLKQRRQPTGWQVRARRSQRAPRRSGATIVVVDYDRLDGLLREGVHGEFSRPMVAIEVDEVTKCVLSFELMFAATDHSPDGLVGEA